MLTPAGDAWAARVEGLGLTALVRELAWQVQPLAAPVPVLPRPGDCAWSESLRAPALVAKLEAALGARLDIERPRRGFAGPARPGRRVLNNAWPRKLRPNTR